MKNRRKIIYNGIRIFLLSFILFSLGIKIGGLHPKEINPLTWQEFFGHIGDICILSICFSVLYILLGRKIEKIIGMANLHTYTPPFFFFFFFF